MEKKKIIIKDTILRRFLLVLSTLSFILFVPMSYMEHVGVPLRIPICQITILWMVVEQGASLVRYLILSAIPPTM